MAKKKASIDYENGVYAVLLTAVAYGLGSLAIDNGSLIFYGLAFICLYWAVHFAKIFVKQTMSR